MYNSKNISSDTSDPSTAHMRVFVGNINTSAITKTCLQEIFCKYGNVTGISIHRGYAFIQYNSVEAAQIAAQSQHQQRITNQVADVKIAAEPRQKPFPPLPPPPAMAPFIAPPSDRNTVTSKPTWKRTPQSSKSKVHNGRISKTSSQTNNKTYSSKVKSIVSSVTDVSHIREELLEIRSRIDALLSYTESSEVNFKDQNGIPISSESTLSESNSQNETTSTTDHMYISDLPEELQPCFDDMGTVEVEVETRES